MENEKEKRPIIIGITGNIGSGKSSFCTALKRYGQRVFYADQIAHEVLTDPEVMAAMTQRWGDKILENGQLSHPKLGALVFGNPEELGYLNSLVHPGTLEQMQKVLQENLELDSIVYEVPLLFEAGMKACFDFVVLVTASPQTRGKRLQHRDKLHPDEIQQRINSQMPDKDKQQQSDLVIQNEGTIDDLRQEAMKFVSQIPKLQRREITKFTEI